MVSKALPARRAPCALLLATAPFGPEVDDGCTVAFGTVVDEPGEGGEGDACRAGVAGSERAGETIGEGLPHVRAEGRRRGGGRGRGLGRRCSFDFVPNLVPKGRSFGLYLKSRVVTFISDSAWYRRWDSNPQTLSGSGF